MIPGLPSATFALGAVLLALAGSVTGYLHGRNAEAGDRAQEDLVANKLADALAADKRKRIDRLALDLETARAHRQIVYRTITNEVTRYADVTPAADRCLLPGTWRLRHDLAATGETATDAARVAAGAAEPVTDAAALGTVADNYGTCREWREQIVGWQRWFAEVSR